jgi:poly-beta-1,6-N-acetyl-D-glucosamine synthase
MKIALWSDKAWDVKQKSGGVFSVAGKQIIVLVPAHNEEFTIAATVQAILGQAVPVARVIVVADNCSDGTELAAKESGAEVFVTQDNKAMKAGALNQALAMVLPDLEDDDLVGCIDADSIVGLNFTAEAVKAFAATPDLGGVSGVYSGRKGGGITGWYQQNEFSRWGFDSRMYKGRTVILSGAASIFTARALRKIAAARSDGVLGGTGIYNERNITEDFELSLALLHTGSRIRNLLSVQIETAVKPTWRELGIQRLRWDRGINEGLFQYGFTRFTRKVWFQRVMYAVYVPISLLVFAVLGYRAYSGSLFMINPLWLSISAVMMTQRAVTIVRTRGVRNAFAAFLILPEMPYDTFLQWTFARALAEQITGRTAKWR